MTVITTARCAVPGLALGLAVAPRSATAFAPDAAGTVDHPMPKRVAR